MWQWMVKVRNILPPAAAMSLKRGGEVRPSKRKAGWEEGTEVAGAGAGPPGKEEATYEGLRGHGHRMMICRNY